MRHSPKILIACECSGRVKTAFRKLGHNAWSCDLKPSEISDDPYHIQDDVLKHLNDGWDLMIAHPDCRLLSRAGLRWIINNTTRQVEMKQSAEFFNILLNADIFHIAIENPTQHRYAREYIRNPDQTIEPYHFGHSEHKRTCLWLKNLPLLNPTCALWNKEPVQFIDKRGGKHYSVDMLPPGKNRAADRARTFQGIAEAMATQWSAYVSKVLEEQG